MDNDKPQKINIGFQGGPVLSARVAPSELKELRDKLVESGWHDLTAADTGAGERAAPAPRPPDP